LTSKAPLSTISLPDAPSPLIFHKQVSIMSFTKLLFALSAVVGATVAAPAARSVQDVYVPPVTYPTAGVEWVIGQSYNVTWDTTNPPKQITNKQGMVVLAKNYSITGLNTPLAAGFSILDGTVRITVPQVEPDTDYQVVLFGDSGNYSPTFTITNGTSSA